MSAIIQPGGAAITMMRLLRYTLYTLWVTKMVVNCWACHNASMSLLNLKRVISSSAVNGSSISKRRGSVTIAQAIDTRFSCRLTAHAGRPVRIERGQPYPVPHQSAAWLLHLKLPSAAEAAIRLQIPASRASMWVLEIRS